MLKFIFWSLLGSNAVLYALGQGYLGSYRSEEHEPERIKNQLNADQVIVAPRADAPAAVPGERAPGERAPGERAPGERAPGERAANEAAPAPGANPPAGAGAPAATASPAAPASSAAAVFASAATLPPSAVATAPAKPVPLVCLEVGDFSPAEARRFEAKLAPLDLGERLSKQSVAGQEVSSYIVHIPPQGSKEAADRKAAELKELGVSNYFVMSDNTPMRWAISLGVFKSEGGAQNLLAALVKQGVHSAKVSPRYSAGKVQSYRFADLDLATKARLEQIKAGFPDHQFRACQ
ncbi:MAG: SPOR domain-containing protein [Pseudomonadota bacterium]